MCVLLETRNLWILERIWLEFVSVPRTYFIYILASLSGTLYVGVTNNLHRRRAEHRIGSADSFTTRYRVDRLVYFECYSDILQAIAREKEIKSWRREKKIALIGKTNPEWRNLASSRLPRA